MVPTGGAKSPGEQVYVQNCMGCHGVDRRGNPDAKIPALVDVAQRLTRDEMREVINKGRGVMPPWGFLSIAQREAVTDFLRGEDTQKRSGSGKGDWQTYLPDLQKAVPPPYGHTGYNRFTDPDGYPAVRPPWGTLNAIDLNTGEYLWRVPLGEYPELTAQGVAKTGTENYGGPLVTAGGLLFMGAAKDECFRAFDAKTGAELWKFKLPAGGYATPATYSVDGRQYIVIACGGGKMGTKSGDAYVAFALPK
jgi:quinoprotein glucose dehydrogenase